MPPKRRAQRNPPRKRKLDDNDKDSVTEEIPGRPEIETVPETKEPDVYSPPILTASPLVIFSLGQSASFVTTLPSPPGTPPSPLPDHFVLGSPEDFVQRKWRFPEGLDVSPRISKDCVYASPPGSPPKIPSDHKRRKTIRINEFDPKEKIPLEIWGFIYHLSRRGKDSLDPFCGSNIKIALDLSHALGKNLRPEAMRTFLKQNYENRAIGKLFRTPLVPILAFEPGHPLFAKTKPSHIYADCIWTPIPPQDLSKNILLRFSPEYPDNRTRDRNLKERAFFKGRGPPLKGSSKYPLKEPLKHHDPPRVGSLQHHFYNMSKRFETNYLRSETRAKRRLKYNGQISLESYPDNSFEWREKLMTSSTVFYNVGDHIFDSNFASEDNSSHLSRTYLEKDRLFRDPGSLCDVKLKSKPVSFYYYIKAAQSYGEKKMKKHFIKTTNEELKAACGEAAENFAFGPGDFSRFKMWKELLPEEEKDRIMMSFYNMPIQEQLAVYKIDAYYDVDHEATHMVHYLVPKKNANLKAISKEDLVFSVMCEKDIFPFSKDSFGMLEGEINPSSVAQGCLLTITPEFYASSLSASHIPAPPPKKAPKICFSDSYRKDTLRGPIVSLFKKTYMIVSSCETDPKAVLSRFCAKKKGNPCETIEWIFRHRWDLPFTFCIYNNKKRRVEVTISCSPQIENAPVWNANLVLKPGSDTVLEIHPNFFCSMAPSPLSESL